MFVSLKSVFMMRQACWITSYDKKIHFIQRFSTISWHMHAVAHWFKTVSKTHFYVFFCCQFYKLSGVEKRLKIFAGFRSRLTVKNAENRILCGSMFCQQTRTLESNEKTKQHKTCACAFMKIVLRVNTVSAVSLDAVTLNPCLWGKLEMFIYISCLDTQTSV